MRVLIVGGGIGGLSAALCAHHFGHHVTVFEKAAEIKEIGAGLQLPPNAMKVFEALGIDDVISQHACQPEAIEARMGKSGRPIFTIPLARQAVEMWGSPYWHIHRADYIQALTDVFNRRVPQSLELGANVVTYKQDNDAITLTLKDGREFSGDVLIGADGIKSQIREIMLGVDKPVFTGSVAWRMVVPVDMLGDYVPNPTTCLWMGKKRHGITYRLRGGKVANFVGVVERDDWQQDGWRERGSRDEALRDFEGWHPILTNLIQSAKPDTLYRWALFDRAPLPRWSDGRAVLLGDAAHPMLPFLAQGAAMAVEDAWALIREISHAARPVEHSLKAYQNLRYERASQVQAKSRANMKTFHQSTWLGQIKTYGPMWLAGRVMPSIVHKGMDWLYGYDVTQLD